MQNAPEKESNIVCGGIMPCFSIIMLQIIVLLQRTTIVCQYCTHQDATEGTYDRR